MNENDYKKQLNDLHSQIEALRKKRTDLRQRFLSEYSEFMPGDKVKVFSKSSWSKGADWQYRFDAFINIIHDNDFTGKVCFSFQGIKKDGTRSLKSPGWIYSSDLVKVELLHREQNVQECDATDAEQGTKS